MKKRKKIGTNNENFDVNEVENLEDCDQWLPDDVLNTLVLAGNFPRSSSKKDQDANGISESLLFSEIRVKGKCTAQSLRGIRPSPQERDNDAR